MLIQSFFHFVIQGLVETSLDICPIGIFSKTDLSLSYCGASLKEAEVIEIVADNTFGKKLKLIQCKKCGSKIFSFEESLKCIFKNQLLKSFNLRQTCPYCQISNEKLVYDLNTPQGWRKVIFCQNCSQPFIPFE